MTDSADDLYDLRADASGFSITGGGSTQTLLAERQTTHGDFATNARISQALKKIFSELRSGTISDVHKEALDMIALKISRILSGHANYKDHWDDIAGYAKLASKSCDE